MEDSYLENDPKSLQRSFANHLEYSQGKNRHIATRHDLYQSIALSIRDRLMERWNDTMNTYYEQNVKRVYYLSLEYLMGRTLGNSLVNLGIDGDAGSALTELGYDLEDLRELEPDAGLGNGGLGRLAACFLDSMATLGLPADGYGIRYEYGIFDQKFENGFQVEKPDHWLRFGNPWELVRPEFSYPVSFGGHVEKNHDSEGRLSCRWVPSDRVVAVAYDTPVPGYRNRTVNTMRLWSARTLDEFSLKHFNEGDYMRAVEDKIHDENISKVLYPADEREAGKELRLKQEYFFVAATLKDIIRRFRIKNEDLRKLPTKVAIQLNDTHPALAIPELMRLLVDKNCFSWEDAFRVCQGVFGYTNHTILPEALEKWPVYMLEKLLPRHLEIIYEINRRFLEEVAARFPEEQELLTKLSIIEEGPRKSVRMAHLAIVGSHSLNGVAQLHSDILKAKTFHDFYRLWPEKFNNKTNGVTQRRWMKLSNPRLTQLLESHIGGSFMTDLGELAKLVPLADDKKFRAAFREVKAANKQALAHLVKQKTGITINPDSIFDCQIKRLHEYKRQLMNVLHIIALYNRIKSGEGKDMVPRTFIFGAKAAPAYKMAKLIIKLINSVADVVNDDPDVGDRLKVVFLENYSVSLAQRIIPAADVSEQISTAGMEASGTGCMKLSMNGALTIGTLDGANVEILEEVGAENMFIFGLKTDEVLALRASGYRPRDVYDRCRELRQVLDMISGGVFYPEQPYLFAPLVNSLLDGGDYYMVMADYESYARSQEELALTYRDQEKWSRLAILNVAKMGKFSSDRTIRQYADEIWNVKPVDPTAKQPGN
ncbi:glycogen/starch/alpha-glucan phosphorylase [Myxococcota bacterium]|nr:glycogen/starch/alpha-glucan phosphorylase [Myxococcota bacterium]MBU1511654.1 glycogen/starch/alpha-glucan phosphorylase [Myxococcota bacterium]